MQVKRVFVVGAGLMGSGIAQVCAQAGMLVCIYDVNQDSVKKALKNIAWSTGKLIEKKKISGSLDEVMGRIEPVDQLSKITGVDLVIEAVFERLNLKQEVFSQVDQFMGEKTLLASNTSAISITELAAVTKHSSNVLGLHFFNPVPMMQAVEVVRGIATSDATFEAGRRFVESIGKEPILVQRDIGGFLINRINYMAITEAMRLVEQGVATEQDIDKGLRLASGRKMGIFETSDMVGLDVTYSALNAIYNESKDSRFYPPMILRRKVIAGELGRKTGKGWYQYDHEGNRLETGKKQ
jgi:3-hydroxybutyryl-CoA dehydrogenase